MTPHSAASEAPADEHSTPPADAGATAAPASEAPFFAWIRTLGLARRTGWLGGVCAGISERIGIDPILVRGIVVVLAVIGAPVVLLYAVAWALLPDENGAIHVQELLRGTVTRALPGIVALFLLSFLPVTQGFWHVGALYFDDIGWGGAIARAAWAGVVLIAAIVLVVWLARRASGDPVVVPATTDDRHETVPSEPVASAASAPASASPLTAIPDPGAEPPRPADATDEELAEWKLQQEEWKRQRAEWAADQRRTERERRQAAAHSRALAAAEASRERARIRRLTDPRAGAGVVFLIVGVAVVAAAVATLLASQARGLAGTASAAWIIGAATLVAVLGIGTVIVALCRRRSGGLTFFSVVAALLLAFTLVLPADRQLLLPGAGYTLKEPGRYAHLWGGIYVDVEDRGGSPRVIDVWNWDGHLDVQVQEGATVRIDAESDRYLGLILSESFPDGSMQHSSWEPSSGRTSITFGEGTPDVILKVWTHQSGIGVSTWSQNPLPASREPDYIDRISEHGTQLEPLRPGDDRNTTPESTESSEGVAP